MTQKLCCLVLPIAGQPRLQELSGHPRRNFLHAGAFRTSIITFQPSLTSARPLRPVGLALGIFHRRLASEDHRVLRPPSLSTYQPAGWSEHSSAGHPFLRRGRALHKDRDAQTGEGDAGPGRTSPGSIRSMPGVPFPTIPKPFPNRDQVLTLARLEQHRVGHDILQLHWGQPEAPPPPPLSPLPTRPLSSTPHLRPLGPAPSYCTSILSPPTACSARPIPAPAWPASVPKWPEELPRLHSALLSHWSPKAGGSHIEGMGRRVIG